MQLNRQETYLILQILKDESPVPMSTDDVINLANSINKLRKYLDRLEDKNEK